MCFKEGDLCLQYLFQLHPFRDRRTQKLETGKDETLGLPVVIKQHGLGLGNACVGDLRNLFESVAEGGNSVLVILHDVSKILLLSPGRNRMLV